MKQITIKWNVLRPQQRNLPDFMYLINVNILESQRAHSTNDLVFNVGLKMTDWWVETCSLMYK